MRTIIAITLSIYVEHEGFNKPETFLMQQLDSEHLNYFQLLVSRQVVAHRNVKKVKDFRHQGACDVSLFISITSDCVPAVLLSIKKSLKRYMNREQVRLVNDWVY